jgi:hypothetical protein
MAEFVGEGGRRGVGADESDIAVAGRKRGRVVGAHRWSLQDRAIPTREGFIDVINVQCFGGIERTLLNGRDVLTFEPGGSVADPSVDDVDRIRIGGNVDDSGEGRYESNPDLVRPVQIIRFVHVVNRLRACSIVRDPYADGHIDHRLQRHRMHVASVIRPRVYRLERHGMLLGKNGDLRIAPGGWQ